MITILIRLDDHARAVKVIQILRDHFFGLDLYVISRGGLYRGDQYVDSDFAGDH